MPITFGSSNGPILPLGKVTIAASGTPMPILTNLTYKRTGAGGAIKVQQIRVSAPSANAGDIYLVFNNAPYASNNGQGVILRVSKGTTETLAAMAQNNPFQPDEFSLDGTTGDGAFITLVIA